MAIDWVDVFLNTAIGIFAVCTLSSLWNVIFILRSSEKPSTSEYIKFRAKFASEDQLRVERLLISGWNDFKEHKTYDWTANIPLRISDEDILAVAKKYVDTGFQVELKKDGYGDECFTKVTMILK